MQSAVKNKTCDGPSHPSSELSPSQADGNHFYCQCIDFQGLSSDCSFPDPSNIPIGTFILIRGPCCQLFRREGAGFVGPINPADLGHCPPNTPVRSRECAAGCNDNLGGAFLFLDTVTCIIYVLGGTCGTFCQLVQPTPVPGDKLLDCCRHDLYELVTDCTWSLCCSLQGATGATGSTGATSIAFRWSHWTYRPCRQYW